MKNPRRQGSRIQGKIKRLKKRNCGIDDEFAKDVSEYETLEELKKSIEAEILDKRGKEADSMFEEEIIDKVINMTVESRM